MAKNGCDALAAGVSSVVEEGGFALRREHTRRETQGGPTRRPSIYSASGLLLSWLHRIQGWPVAGCCRAMLVSGSLGDVPIEVAWRGQAIEEDLGDEAVHVDELKPP